MNLAVIKMCATILCLRSIIVPLVMMTLLSVASAQIDSTDFDNPSQYTLYQKAIQELRCLVCQNQTLADSNADLAKDLRRKTYEMTKQNKSYEDIIQYMVERYGEFVLYRPRITPATWLLWFSPFAILIIIIGFALVRVRNMPKPTHVKFSKEEIDNAKSLINSNFSS